MELRLPEADLAWPPEIAIGLYRVAQEALANVVSHARARRVRVGLEVAAGRARLTVADDGAGFSPERARRGEGLGLTSIKERVQLLRGETRIDSAPGSGTVVEVWVPLPVAEGWLGQLGRLVRQHRGFVTAAALVMLALAAGLVATSIQARRARQEAVRAEAAARFLEDLFRASDPKEARGTLPDTRELLRRGTARVAAELAGQPLLKARLLDTLGGIHTELALYDQARPLLEEALSLRERLHRREHPEVAATLVRLGALAQLSGQGDAPALFERALALFEADGGSEQPEVADVLNKLGTSQAAAGELERAEATLRRALALGERLWGAEDPRLAKALHNLSGIAYYRSIEEPARLAEAEQLLGRALAIRERALPADDLDLAGSREALALLWRRQGRTEEAVRLFEQVAATTEKAYGPQHPEVARAVLNLGLARSDLGEIAAARKLVARALAILERTVETQHPLRVRALSALAELQPRR